MFSGLSGIVTSVANTFGQTARIESEDDLVVACLGLAFVQAQQNFDDLLRRKSSRRNTVGGGPLQDLNQRLQSFSIVKQMENSFKTILMGAIENFTLLQLTVLEGISEPARQSVLQTITETVLKTSQYHLQSTRKQTIRRLLEANRGVVDDPDSINAQHDNQRFCKDKCNRTCTPFNEDFAQNDSKVSCRLEASTNSRENNIFNDATANRVNLDDTFQQKLQAQTVNIIQARLTKTEFSSFELQLRQVSADDNLTQTLRSAADSAKSWWDQTDKRRLVALIVAAAAGAAAGLQTSQSTPDSSAVVPISDAPVQPPRHPQQEDCLQSDSTSCQPSLAVTVIVLMIS